ncbi:hypothetical protein BJY59DRAFT_691749 [Rhodotorula toruloides]
MPSRQRTRSRTLARKSPLSAREPPAAFVARRRTLFARELRLRRSRDRLVNARTMKRGHRREQLFRLQCRLLALPRKGCDEALAASKCFAIASPCLRMLYLRMHCTSVVSHAQFALIAGGRRRRIQTEGVERCRHLLNARKRLPVRFFAYSFWGGVLILVLAGREREEGERT